MPLHDVREEVTVEGAVLAEQVVQIEMGLGGDELVDSDLTRGEICPLGQREAVFRIRFAVADRLEDHLISVGESRGDA